MIKKLHIYLIISTLGLFLLPSLTYACGTQSEKECCKKETTSKQEHRGCSEESHAADKNSGCDGQCGHSNCISVSAHSSMTYSNELQFILFNFYKRETNFNYTLLNLSSDYVSLWLIPKIS